MQREDGTISTKSNNYTKTNDTSCQLGQNKGKLKLGDALTLCDKFPCEGIWDKDCDGTSVVVCQEIAPLEEGATSEGCTYVKDGNISLIPIATL